MKNYVGERILATHRLAAKAFVLHHVRNSDYLLRFFLAVTPTAIRAFDQAAPFISGSV